MRKLLPPLLQTFPYAVAMVMDNWLLPLSIAVLGDETSVDQHLELGKKFLQEGQLSDALYHYSAAIGMALSLSPLILIVHLLPSPFSSPSMLHANAMQTVIPLTIWCTLRERRCI